MHVYEVKIKFTPRHLSLLLEPACKCCGATGVSLKRCAGCETVYYCSPECQKKDWKEGDENRHKIQCARLIEMRARYVEKAKREIEEQMVRFGVSPNSSGNEGGKVPAAFHN